MDLSGSLDLAEEIRRPLDGSDGTGRDTRFDPEHSAIRAELDKLDPVAGKGGTVDWGAVRDGSLALLRTQSKDLCLASYLCVAMALTRGLASLTQVLLGISALVREQWPTLHPRGRERRRVAQIEWALERLRSHFEANGPTGASMAEIEAVRAALRGLEDSLAAACGARITAFGEVIAAMSRWSTPPTPPFELARAVETVREQVALAEADASPVFAAEGVNPAAPVPPAPVATESAAGETRAPEMSLVAMMAGLRTLARRMRSEDPAHPQAYRLLRLGIWLDLEAPLQTRNGRSSALPIDPRTRVAIERAESGNQWQEVVELAEVAVLRSPLALDLQRICHRALLALGSRFVEASRAVSDEMQRLVARDGTLLHALARDGSMLADDATRAWVASLAPSAAPSVNLIGSNPDEGGDSGESGDLLERLDARLASCASARSRAEMRLRTAVHLGERGRHAMAARVLAPLFLEVERLNLVAWDPAFCASVAEALLRSARQVPVPEFAIVLDKASSLLWMVKPCVGARFQPE